MLKDKKILVIDDDMDICEFCRIVLAKEGAAVTVTTSAKDGLAAARRNRPDLVLLDIMMEDADSGFKLAQQLADEFKGLPVVMLSSIAAASSQIFDTSSLPVSEFVEKPIASEHLIRIATRLLGGK